MNYFSVVLRIMFLMCMENKLFIGPRIIFRSIANIFWVYNVLWALQLKWTGSSLWLPLGDHFENFEVEECFQRECQGEKLSGKETKGVFIFLTKSVRSQQSVRSWWGFLDRRFNRGDYEATSRLVHNSNPYWTWHVCPIEQFFTQSYTSSLCPYYTCWLLERRCGEFSAPYPELQEGSPNSNPDGGAWEQKSIKFPS